VHTLGATGFQFLFLVDVPHLLSEVEI